MNMRPVLRWALLSLVLLPVSARSQNLTNSVIKTTLPVADRTTTDAHQTEDSQYWTTKPANARFASGAQRSAREMAGPFARPTVQLATQDYPNSEPAIDLITGPNVRLGNSLVAAFGRPTPLDSQVVTRAYAMPPPFSRECKTLTTGLTTHNGYNPGLAPASMGSPACLAHAYTNIAILDQNSSSFPARYGARFRTAGKIGCKAGGANARDCAVSYGVLDLTFGQDQIEKRATLGHIALRLDGMLPVLTGKAAYLYLFGSAFAPLGRNQGVSPLILPSSAVPSPGAIVLPLPIPERDFYRLGVGVNLNQVSLEDVYFRLRYRWRALAFDCFTWRPWR